MVQPPSTARTVPVQKVASSDRNTAARATSSTVPKRPSRVASAMRWREPGGTAAVMSVSTKPGARTFTRTPLGASSFASDRAKPTTAALALA